MESFFRRMSSIVRKNNHKSSDVDENNEDNNNQQRNFRQIQRRRRSAPDIRRRAIPIDRIPVESDQQITSFEPINSQRLTTPTTSNYLTRKQYNSTSKLVLFIFLI